MKTSCRKIIIIIWIMIAMLLMVSVALSEQTVWNCPECGRTGNTNNYCGGCGHPAPSEDSSSNPSSAQPIPINSIYIDTDGTVVITLQFSNDRKANYKGFELFSENYKDTFTFDQCTFSSMTEQGRVVSFETEPSFQWFEIWRPSAYDSFPADDIITIRLKSDNINDLWGKQRSFVFTCVPLTLSEERDDSSTIHFNEKVIFPEKP